MSLPIISETHRDPRGLVATFPFVSAQCNSPFTAFAGTLRGLHYRDPAEEKVVLCVRGAIYDVIVDLKTGEWFPLYMAAGYTPRYVRKGFAHGFQALEDDTEVFYVLSELYDPEAERGYRYDSFGIKWPLPPRHVSVKDNALPYLPFVCDRPFH